MYLAGHVEYLEEVRFDLPPVHVRVQAHMPARPSTLPLVDTEQVVACKPCAIYTIPTHVYR